MVTLFEQSERSPQVTYDGSELVIKGRSFMDDAVDFYRNLIANVSGLDFSSLEVVVNLDYFNTSSSKCLLELFRSFEKMVRAGRSVKIFWYYAESCPDLEEAGEDYRDLLSDVPFELVGVEG